MTVPVFRYFAQDVPLFNGILSDLFPGVALPEVRWNSFYTNIFT